MLLSGSCDPAADAARLLLPGACDPKMRSKRGSVPIGQERGASSWVRSMRLTVGRVRSAQVKGTEGQQ